MHPRTLTTTVALVILPLFGCRSTTSTDVAPIHTWAAPQLHSAVGRSVVLATIIGDPPQAARLAEALTATRPLEPSRSVRLVHQADLQRHVEIQLASTAPNIPSDLALLSAARKEGLEYLLIGEILKSRGGGSATSAAAAKLASLPPELAAQAEPATPSELASDPPSQGPASTASSTQRLTISWRLLDVGEARVVGGMPVSVSAASAATLYPDLASSSGTEEARLATAAARETWKLLTPSIRRETVRLAEPYLLTGASAVRRGNQHAAAVRWAEAEQAWQQALEQHPANHAAVHNLALAAAARQDFRRGKALAQQALQMHGSKDYERTVVWIEGRQREAAEAFGLPRPEEGWLFSPD
ncbi:tetratricopeptide repeat protein [Candidatus Laterigemmans baculatus]|uniref:tetratricopeptide repeat protein n=1 Tax=Candidatus Laterigemmans baculatus TaxID=2770505 RepID=UPI0013DD09C8|nr:hypothetical protein [Candidatus Laterigemmans baculatus]